MGLSYYRGSRIPESDYQFLEDIGLDRPDPYDTNPALRALNRRIAISGGLGYRPNEM